MMTFTFPHQNKNGFAQRISSFSIPNFQHRDFNQMKMGRCTKSNLRYVFLEKFTFFANVGIMINFTRQAGQAKQLASDGYHCIAVELHCIVSIACMHWMHTCITCMQCSAMFACSAVQWVHSLNFFERYLNKVACCSHIVSCKSNKCCL